MSAERELAETLRSGFDRRDVDGIRRAARSLVDLRRRIGLHAYWHALGFFRVELAADDAGNRYALHCWPAGERNPQAPAWLIHGHAWELESVILSGQIRDLRYESDRGAQSQLQGPLYVSSANGSSSYLRRTDDTLFLSERQERVLAADAFYEIPLSCYHESHIGISGHCLTLIRRRPRARSHARILGEFGFPEVLVYQREPVAPATIEQYLRLI